MRSLPLLASLLLSCPAFALSEQDAVQKTGEELIECAAYYLSATVALDKAGEVELSDQFQGFAKYSLELAQTYFPVSVITKKLSMAQSANAWVIKSKGVNTLIPAYAEKCKAALEKPGERKNYWLQHNN